MLLHKSTVIVGISSGIAAYKIIDLISLLKNNHFDVHVIMTENATKMIKPSGFEKISGNKVYFQLYPPVFKYQKVLKTRTIDHIRLASSADLLLIAPATANIIGKIAHGIADDLLTTTVLTTKAPILICPSMNTNMWTNPLVQENLGKLKSIGIHILPPSFGKLACGSEGVGRLPDVENIFHEIISLLHKNNKLQGKKIMVTAGGTVEPIDAVRMITNKSSGKMGVALAEECYRQGAEVILLRSCTSVVSHYPILQELFETAADLEKLIKKNVNNYNVLFHAAAVSDFVLERKTAEKIESVKPLTLNLNPAPKILHKIRSWNPKILLVGFKAVYQKKDKELIEIGLEKLKQSKSDYIIVNDVGREGVGFGVDDNEVYIISPKGLVAKVEKTSKNQVARQILKIVFH